MARLQLHATGDTPRTHDVSEGASIGRIEGNDIVIDHPSVSRRHATVQLRGEDWWVVDLGSANGLKINGRATKEARIVPGDTIAIGSVPFKVEEAPQVKVQPGPHVEFNDSMFEESGTVMRKISDFNLEFGLDPSVAAAPQTATAPGTERAIVTREKIFSVLVQVAKVDRKSVV